MIKFRTEGMLTTRPVNTLDYSVEFQRCSDASVTHRYRRWHTISFYLNSDCPVLRTWRNQHDKHLFNSCEVGIYPASDSEAISWPAYTEAIHVHINPDLVQRAARLLGGNGLGYLPRYLVVYDSKLYDLGLDFLSFDGLNKNNSHADLVADICRHLARNYVRPNNAMTPGPCIGSLQLSELLNQMHDHNAVVNSVTGLAAMVGLSVRQFSALFSNAMGTSAHDYLLRSRIENAKHAIQTSPQTLTEIALNNGFYDQAHFTKVFKSRVGYTPSKFSSRLC